MTDLYSLTPTKIILYGVTWCGDCRRSRQVFAETGINFVDIDIDQDEKAAAFVRQLNRGSQSVPTIVFPDGTTLTEPDRFTLANKLKEYRQTA